MQKRLFSLDLIRCVAIIFVIAGHFFAFNTDYQSTPFDEGMFSMFLQGMGVILFRGVAFFILMTGYLNSKKTEYSWQYVKGMNKVLLSYLFFSIVTILFRQYYFADQHSWKEWGMKILDYSAIPYAWYIEMWIGLYLLTPLLNKAYEAMRDQMKWVIGILFFLTALPYWTNRFDLHILPGFWQGFYPVLFFFIGRTLHDVQIKVKSSWLILVALVICMIDPLFTCVVMPHHDLVYVINPQPGAFGAILAVALFLLMLKTDSVSDKINGIIKWIVSYISKLSLDIFLCCYIADQLLYPWFKERFFENQPQFGIWFFVIVPCLIVMCCLMAQLKQWMFKLIKL